MLSYVDNENNVGYIPDRKELKEISEKVSKLIMSYNCVDLLVAIPDAANDLIGDFNKYSIKLSEPLTKCSWVSDINTISRCKSIIVLDDIICHGETIKKIVNQVYNLQNIKLIVVYFHIVSKKICLYDIEKGIFTLRAENKLYYIYFIEEKFLLRIPTLIYATHNFILMKSDIVKHGFDFKYFLNGEKICREDILRIL